MSLRFRYDLERMGKPITSLGGRWVRPRPIISATLIGPAKTYQDKAHLDPAADDTIFEEKVAAWLGIDLTNSPTGQGAGVSAQSVPLRYAEVTLHLTDGTEVREWLGWVGFTPVRIVRPLLGFAGCLQFFTATFYGDIEEAELTPNRLYPGT
jgi:hypothetical protein